MHLATILRIDRSSGEVRVQLERRIFRYIGARHGGEPCITGYDVHAELLSKVVDERRPGRSSRMSEVTVDGHVGRD